MVSCRALLLAFGRKVGGKRLLVPTSEIRRRKETCHVNAKEPTQPHGRHCSRSKLGFAGRATLRGKESRPEQGIRQ
jgi:hypothetical protein